MTHVTKALRAGLFLLSLLIARENLRSQTISNYYFGVNAWMPDTVGDVNACQDPPCIKYGKLHTNWQKVKDSKAQLVRYGGIAPDKNMPTNYQYIRMIDSIRANGMEPMIQVPYWSGRYTAQQAANIVQYINITRGRNIKYWVIGNEPDLKYNYGASQIAAYIKSFASAMKAVDSTILIIGPESAWFSNSVADALTLPGGQYDITGKDANGRYYIDFFSFHTYPLGNNSTTLPSRYTVMTKLTESGSFQDDLAYLNAKLATANNYHNRTGSSAIKAAVTEANIVYTNHPSDNLTGVGANSFIGAQFVAEMYGIGLKQGVAFLNLWSVIEGGSSVYTNIGYIDPVTNKNKPLFYHFKMMAENFKGTSINCSSNQIGVKAFASKNGQQTTVLLMNEELNTNHNYSLRLNTASISGTNTLKINTNAGIAVEYADVIPNQSTMMLTFDGAGNLTKKCVYSLSVHAAYNLPPSCTTFSSNSNTDLVVQNPATSSSSVLAGGTLTLNSTLFNTGTSASQGVKTGYYLSSDTLFDNGDNFLGASVSNTIAATSGVSITNTINIPSGKTPGNYYILYYADYDNAVPETNENNNIRYVPVYVISNSAIDLVVKNQSASSPTILAGNTLSLSATIFNAGTSTSPGGKIGYYISTDTILDNGDGFMAYSSSVTLPAGTGAVKTKTVLIYSSMPAGKYYILCHADYDNLIAETDENNNISHIPIEIVTISNIDLVINSAFAAPSTVPAGGTLNITSTLFNAGSTNALTAKTGYYFSTDTVFDSGDTFKGATGSVSLAPNTGALLTSTLSTTGLNPGSYYVLCYADYDNVVSETNENNNIRRVPVTITGIGHPDLVINTPSASATSLSSGGKLSVGAIIFNAGNAAAASSQVGYYLSVDTVPDSGDIYLGFSDGQMLSAGTGAAKSAWVKLPAKQATGNYYILYHADHLSAVAESNEQNNIKYLSLTITGKNKGGPNSSIIASEPNTMVAGDEHTSRSTVSNTVTGKLSVHTTGYLSHDTIADMGDQFLGLHHLYDVAPGSKVENIITFLIPSNTSPGNYFILYSAEYKNESGETVSSHAWQEAVNIAGTVTDIRKENEEARLEIFPNPSSGRITVVLEGIKTGQNDFTVEIIDISGRQVYARKGDFYGNREVIDLPSGMQSGSYTIRLRHDQQVISRHILLYR